jgi:hypothetical protein
MRAPAAAAGAKLALPLHTPASASGGAPMTVPCPATDRGRTTHPSPRA